MHALLLGFAALVILLFLLHSFTTANTGRVARHIRLAVGTIVMAIAIAFFVRGAAAYGFPLATFALWLLLRRPSTQTMASPGGGNTSRGAHRSSRDGTRS